MRKKKVFNTDARVERKVEEKTLLSGIIHLENPGEYIAGATEGSSSVCSRASESSVNINERWSWWDHGLDAPLATHSASQTSSPLSNPTLVYRRHFRSCTHFILEKPRLFHSTHHRVYTLARNYWVRIGFILRKKKTFEKIYISLLREEKLADEANGQFWRENLLLNFTIQIFFILLYHLVQNKLPEPFSTVRKIYRVLCNFGRGVFFFLTTKFPCIASFPFTDCKPETRWDDGFVTYRDMIRAQWRTKSAACALGTSDTGQESLAVS